VLVDSVLDWLFLGLTWLTSGLPTCVGLGWDFSTIGTLSTYLGSAGLFVDLAALTTVLGLILASETLLLLPRVILFIWRLTPFSG